MQVYLQAFPGAQHSENPIKALCCFRTGARFGEGHLSFSVPPRGGQEQRGFKTRVSHTGRSPRERQEGAQHTREEATQWTSVQLRKFPSCHSFPPFFSSSVHFLSLSLSPPSISNSNLFLPAWGSLINVNWYASSSSSLSSPNAVMLG